MNVVPLSHDSRATVLRHVLPKKNRIKFLNMFKTFATISQHMKILTTLVRLNSQNIREKCACQRDASLSCTLRFQLDKNLSDRFSHDLAY